MDDVLKKVAPDRRSLLSYLVRAAFATPFVVSCSEAEAQSGAGAGSGAYDTDSPKGGEIHIDVSADGHAIVDVKCGPDQPTAKCADLVLEILGKIKEIPKN